MATSYKPPAIPQNHLVGVIDDAESLEALRAELRALSFTSQLLFERPLREVVAETDAADWVFEGIENVVSEENEFRDAYQDEADRGRYVVAVQVDDKNDLPAMKETFERHGGRALRYFGTFAVTDM